MPTRSYTQSAKVDLWPCDCSCYRAHKALYTECQMWPWILTQWSKINRLPPLIIHNLHMEFESHWAKTVVSIVSTRSYTQSAKVDLWPCDCICYRVHKVKPHGHTDTLAHPTTHEQPHMLLRGYKNLDWWCPSVCPLTTDCQWFPLRYHCLNNNTYLLLYSGFILLIEYSRCSRKLLH